MFKVTRGHLVRRNKVLNYVLGLPIYAALALCATPQLVFANGSLSESQAQELFAMAGLIEAEGLTEQAEEVLANLYDQTKSSRVLLELARVQFRLGRYVEADGNFRLVLRDFSPPQGVRDSVRRYLAVIAQRIPSFRPIISVSSDSNPLNFTSNRTVNVLGQALTVTEPPENKTTTGVSIGGIYSRPLVEDTSLSLTARLYDAPAEYFDKVTVVSALNQANFITENGVLELNAERVWTKNNTDTLNLSLGYTKLPVQEKPYRLSGNVGKNLVLDSSIYDSIYLDGSFTYFARQSSNYPIEVEIGAASVRRQDKYNSNDSKYVRSKISSKTSLLSPSYEFVTRQVMHRARDPFFLKVREDLNFVHTLGFDIRNYHDFIAAYPQLKIAFETNNSSIDYFDYEKLTVSVEYDFL